MILSFFYSAVLLGLAILLLPLWVIWLACVPKLRAGFLEKLGFLPASTQHQLQALPLQNRVWLHAVSVGELNAAKPLIQMLADKGYPLILSTTTLTGNRLARQTYSQIPILYFPFDLPFIIQKTLRRLSPALIVILETELWPNLLFYAHQHNIPAVLVNGRLSPRSFQRYQYFKWFFQAVLRHFSLCLMQSEADAKRILSLGVSPTHVLTAGNLKFDLPAVAPTDAMYTLERVFNFPTKSPVIVFASTHKGEEELFITMTDYLRSDFPDIRVILAPRHPERAKSVGIMLTAHGTRYSVRSQLSETSPNPQDVPVILLDSIGELNAVFTLSTLACMGGSFVDSGGHNPLEPINAHIPVIFGPYMANFKSITAQILEAHAGFQASDTTEAAQIIRELLTRPEYYNHIVHNGNKLMDKNRGATQIIAQHLEALLKPTSSERIR